MPIGAIRHHPYIDLMFDSLPIRWKTALIPLFSLALPIAAAIYATSVISEIKDQTAEIAFEDIPLTKALTEIVILQLEQEVHFERAIAYASQAVSDPRFRADFEENVKRFQSDDIQIRAAFQEAEKIIKKVGSKTSSSHNTAEFLQMSKTISVATTERKEYEQLTNRVFAAIRQDATIIERELLLQIADIEERLDLRLTSALREIEDFTEASLIHIDVREKEGLRIVLMLTLLSILGGPVMGVIISRSISVPIRNTTAKLNRLAAGETDVEIVDMGSRRDEIAMLERAVGGFLDSIATTQMLTRSQDILQSMNLQIVETMRAPMVVLDAELKVLYASNKFYETFAVTREAAVGEHLYNLADGQWSFSSLRQLLMDTLTGDGAPEDIEVGHTFPEIGYKTVIIGARRVANAEDHPEGVLVAIEDITEIRNAEAMLRNSEARFRSMINTAVDGIILIGDDGAIEVFNPACETIFGYTRDEIIGQNVKLLMPSPEDAEHDEYISRYLETGNAKIIGASREVTGRRKNGEIFPMGLSVAQVPRDRGQAFVGVVQDISRRKAMETELADTAAQLEENLQRERAVHAMHKEFLSMTTHEFRTPLAIIDASAQRIKSNLNPTSLDEEIEKRLASIRVNVTRVNDLIESTLELSKLDYEEIKLDLRVSDLVRACGTVAGKYNELWSPGRVALDTTLTSLEIWADPKLIERIIENLVSNACKYTPPSSSVRISIKLVDANAVVQVSDEGPGIAEKDLSRIFERYVRGETSSGQPGTGLGLYMCQRLVNLHGGTITAKSTIEDGSLFEVTLPIKPATSLDDQPSA